MKTNLTKKHLAIISAVLVAFTAFAGCASQKCSAKQPSLPEQNTVAEQSSASAADKSEAPANQTSSEAVPSGISAAYADSYELLIAHKTENYAQRSIADFNAALASMPELYAAMADVISGISPDDENYDFFTTTMTLSAQEVYCEHRGEEVAFSTYISKKGKPCSYLDDEGNTLYEFECSVSFQVVYSINAPKQLTVEERDNTLLTFRAEMQNYLNSLTEDQITNESVKKMLTDKAEKLMNSLSSPSMSLSSCDIYLIEISGC